MAEISVNSVTNNELDIEWEENYMSLTNVQEDLPRICKYDRHASEILQFNNRYTIVNVFVSDQSSMHDYMIKLQI
jgi:hypothetical protein